MLSIIIPARGSAADTSACVASVLHSLATLHLVGEFILIDDASDPTLPGTYAELESRDFLALAASRADSVALKYQLPKSVLKDVEFP